MLFDDELPYTGQTKATKTAFSQALLVVDIYIPVLPLA